MNKAYADFGNSRLKLLFDDKLLSFDLKTEVEKARNFISDNNIQEIIYSSVNGSASSKIVDNKYINADKLLHKSKIDFSGIKGMGFDRKIGIIAAESKFPSPLCTIDCGSAITLNFLNGKQCLGGFIIPGLSLRYKSLSQLDALPDIRADFTDFELGTNSENAILIGVLYELAFGIKGLLRKVESSEGISLKSVILTGGDSAIIERALLNLDISVVLQANLNLEGLKILSN